MPVDVPPEMTKAGYEKLKQMASDHGYGWSFNMISEETADAAMNEVFTTMMGAAPPGWQWQDGSTIKVRRGAPHNPTEQYEQPGYGEPSGEDPNA
jgi:hypothetical protein